MCASSMELIPWLIGYFLVKFVLRLAIGGGAWDHTSLARECTHTHGLLSVAFELQLSSVTQHHSSQLPLFVSHAQPSL